MAIAIRGTTPVTATTSGTGAISVTCTGARQPQAGDVLVIIHTNNYYTAAAMPTPTVGGSTTGVTPVTNGAADRGTNLAHIKTYTYVCATTGDRTVSVTETGTADEEKFLAVYVLSGDDNATPVDTAANGVGTSATTSHVAPSVSPASSDAFLICAVQNDGFTAPTYTPPAGMTETYDVSMSGFSTSTGAVLQLAASGATGTKTFTSSQSQPYAAVSIAMKTAAAGGSAASFPYVRRPHRGLIMRGGR